jgi:hypothetical protein
METEMMAIIDGSERHYCRVEGCEVFTWANVPYGFCVDHLREHLMGVDHPHKPFPAVGTVTMPRQHQFEWPPAQPSHSTPFCTCGLTSYPQMQCPLHRWNTVTCTGNVS